MARCDRAGNRRGFTPGDPAKIERILVIRPGQSGQKGDATSADGKMWQETRGSYPGVQAWTGSVFENLHVSVNTSDTAQNNEAEVARFGTSLPIANMAAADGRVVYEVTVARGGAFLGLFLAAEDYDPDIDGDPGDWPSVFSDLEPGDLDARLWADVQAARAYLEDTLGITDYTTVMVMDQGEGNDTGTQRPRYLRQHRTFNARWRERLGSALPIVHPFILAKNTAHIAVNDDLLRLNYEDEDFYVLPETAHLPTYDSVHLNYEGVVQKAILEYNAITNLPTKIMARGDHYVREIEVAADSDTLFVEDYDEVAILTGAGSSIRRTPIAQCRDGRDLWLWRLQAGAGITVQDDSAGTATAFAPFLFANDTPVGMGQDDLIRFRAWKGAWHEWRPHAPPPTPHLLKAEELVIASVLSIGADTQLVLLTGPEGDLRGLDLGPAITGRQVTVMRSPAETGAANIFNRSSAGGVPFFWPDALNSSHGRRLYPGQAQRFIVIDGELVAVFNDTTPPN